MIKQQIIITVIALFDSLFAFSQGYGYRYDFCNSKGEPLRIVKDSYGRQGIYNNRTDKYVLPCKFHFPHGFSDTRNGVGIAENENKVFGMFNTNGELVVPFNYKSISIIDHTNNIFIAQIANGKFGLINTRGQTLAPFVFEHISPQTRNGMIVGRTNGKEGLMDFYGNTVQPFIYDAIYLREEFSYPLASIGNYKKVRNECFARVKYNGYDYFVDENWKVIGERKKIASNSSYTKKSSVGTLFVAGALIAGAVALIHSSSKSSNSSSKSSTSSSSSASSYTKSSTPRSLYEGCHVKCFMWSKGSGYYGRVTAINGDKCKVYIDRVVLKGLLTLYIPASQYTGWKDLSYTTHYDYDWKKQFYGRGEIIEVPKSCLDID